MGLHKLNQDWLNQKKCLTSYDFSISSGTTVWISFPLGPDSSQTEIPVHLKRTLGNIALLQSRKAKIKTLLQLAFTRVNIGCLFYCFSCLPRELYVLT